MLDATYYAMLAAFITHELDAVKRHEWRILPLTSFLPDRIGEQVFIWAHVPLLGVLFIVGDGEPAHPLRIGLAAFAIIHVGLHWLFRKHPDNEFNTASSWALILLTGALGAIYLSVVAVT